LNSRCGSRTRSVKASKAGAHPHADRRAPCRARRGVLRRVLRGA
jgi:hypothetical protein